MSGLLLFFRGTDRGTAARRRADLRGNTCYSHYKWNFITKCITVEFGYVYSNTNYLLYFSCCKLGKWNDYEYRIIYNKILALSLSLLLSLTITIIITLITVSIIITVTFTIIMILNSNEKINHSYSIKQQEHHNHVRNYNHYHLTKSF